MNKETDIIYNLVDSTRNKTLKWKIEGVNVFAITYICNHKITEKRSIEYKFLYMKMKEEYNLYIKMVKKIKDGYKNFYLMNLYSNDRNYGDDMEILYYSINYSSKY